jgi:hypothetical protein
MGGLWNTSCHRSTVWKSQVELWFSSIGRKK